MVTTETHQSQDLLVPTPEQDPNQDLNQDKASPLSPLAGFDPEKMSQGPVNAITVLTLLDKLVNMLDTVQENQHKMEVHQVQMEGVVRGIQADMTKLSKSHSHTSNTVSKLLDKSRKLSVTMKEVRDRMERQGVQVKKLEANHAHLIGRNNFKVLIFQEENEIPSTVFVKDPPPFPRDEIPEESEEPAPSVTYRNESLEAGLHTIDLSSDEDVGLEAELEDEDVWPHDLENIEKSRTEKLKRSSLKKVDSLKKAFSKQNIEKKMNKIGTKIVSAEQREKIKQKTSSLKVSPLTFSIRKPRSSSDSQCPDISAQTVTTEADISVELSSLDNAHLEIPFTEVHAQVAPSEPLQEETVQEEEVTGEMIEDEVAVVSEGVSQEYALSSTLPQEETPEEEVKEKEKEESSVLNIRKEYSKADSRWAVADPTIVSIEILTVVVCSGLGVLLISAVLHHKPYRHFLQVALCVCELYGGWMTFCPDWLMGSPHLDTSHWLYLWVYLVFFNGLWVLAPVFLLIQSWFSLQRQHDEKKK